MTTLEKVKAFFKDYSGIYFGYSGITFYSAEELEEGQVGYSVDENNNSLTTGQEGDWQKNWLVIGTDDVVGDPIFIDTGSEKLQVLTADHEAGAWEGIPIAESLESFVYILSEIQKLSVNRTSPVELQKNPITAEEKMNLIKKIEQNNSAIEMGYWEDFLEDD